MAELYVVCRPSPETSSLEVAATFHVKDQADRELDRLNLAAPPDAPQWHVLVKSPSGDVRG